MIINVVVCVFFVFNVIINTIIIIITIIEANILLGALLLGLTLVYLHAYKILHVQYNTLKSWLIPNPLIKTCVRIRIRDYIRCSINIKGDLSHRGGEGPKYNIFLARLALAMIQTTG